MPSHLRVKDRARKGSSRCGALLALSVLKRQRFPGCQPGCHYAEHLQCSGSDPMYYLLGRFLPG